ncbi:hypothetical protein C7212DRAFT_291074 [Tuber magnatum]|uniref:Uncharacterized protein n=1 Tax=Tuber magnatum TaxID=42249 RepID=A0A317T047_9PEZI|nr:hypothetical protein C7212DRAFT_291074 [Tuber magnatum]
MTPLPAQYLFINAPASFFSSLSTNKGLRILGDDKKRAHYSEEFREQLANRDRRVSWRSVGCGFSYFAVVLSVSFLLLSSALPVLQWPSWSKWDWGRG